MRLVTAAEMQEIDRRAIAGGIAVADLMESAGRAVADEAEKLAGRDASRIEILCGKGHNGGDGLVAARLLHARGHRVRVHLTHAKADLAVESRTQFDRAAHAGVAIEFIAAGLHDPGPIRDRRERPRPGEEEADWMRRDPLGGALVSAHVCVDALLGTGAAKSVEGFTAAVVHWMQHAGAAVLAVDIPSGIDATTGAILGTAVWADATVTFGYPKLGLVLEPGRERAGSIVVRDIGFPPEIVARVTGAGVQRHWVDAKTARRLLPRLEPTAHKYQRGCVLVVAGSRAFPGAAALAATAALRAGAGIVHLAVPAGIRSLLQTKLTEVIVHELPETSAGTLASEAVVPLLEIAVRADAVAIGPGLGVQPETQQCAAAFLDALRIPAVVDADAIPAISSPTHPAGRIVTPHAGELARWIGMKSEEVARNRLEIAGDAAARSGCVVVAKGAPTIIATPDGVLHVNSTGGPALATAGSGDVLTGILAGLLARGLSPEDAARLGVYLHGGAGDLAAAKSSPASVIASDLLSEIGPATPLS